ncbi:MAG: DNA topoisomerase IV subunit A [Deltaproteobacteria bacterium]|nr:DNA topoisomerase IV subunit A [Deltaproteobacteria bacterium]
MREGDMARPAGNKDKTQAGGGGGNRNTDLDAALHEEARRRYLNYAMSVITSRALPDVRDGLKPVQRRILYAMFHDEHLVPDARYRKSATVVGSVLGKYHPHGDTAVYDAMVRMAQDFSLRAPLVDGHGNFGSLDGDAAAAYRYTECRLHRLAMELLEELRKKTVDYRPNFDGTVFEPIVLPARFPNLLVNGATGIAVGMATNIPPHHLGEVTEALLALIDNPELEVKDLLKHVRGPDFPTGGQVVSTRQELREIYETGQGAIKLRGEYKIEEGKRGQKFIIVTSIPYALNKSTLVEAIASVIRERKLAHLTDIRDESTKDVRIVLEIKKDADPSLVMAYLYKHTPLSQNFNVNMTCLVPTDNPEVGSPNRLNLKQALRYFLDFRFQVVTRRFAHELEELRRRIHVLEGLAKIFDALDETIRIIRRSEGKADAAAKLMKRFDLDEQQVDAILELKLYKLARLEIQIINEELREKTKEASRIEAILKSEARRWGVVRGELEAVRNTFADKRRTKIGGVGDEPEFSEEHFILAEDVSVVLTRDGWVKRVRELKDPSQTRVREGDEVVAVLPGSTRENVVFFSTYGSAYVARINDIPPSTGYGDPVQKLFKFDDGERIVAALSLDPRLRRPEKLLAVTRKGYGLRIALSPHVDVSTRAGRKYARPADGDEVVSVLACEDQDIACIATESGHVLLCPISEINLLANPGRGVTVVKVGDDDRVIGVGVARAKNEVALIIESAAGKVFEIRPSSYSIASRGGKGHQVAKRTQFKIVPSPIKVTTFTPTELN